MNMHIQYTLHIDIMDIYKKQSTMNSVEKLKLPLRKITVKQENLPFA